jgi:hypothetical protein
MEPTNAAPPAPADEARDLSPRPFPGPVPSLAIRAILGVRRGLQRLTDRLIPAELAIFEAALGITRTQLLGAAARHRIADHLAGGPRTAAELAALTGLDEGALHRALRGLSSLGVFRLGPDGRFENNRLSGALRSGLLTRTREWVQYFGSASNCAAWCDLEGTLRTGGNAFERVHGMSVWAWFDAHPDERETFAQAMMGMTVQDAPVVATVYPFGEVKRLCDVGGGRGTLLSEVLIRHPHLRGVLYDAPGVIESARELLRRRGVEARVEAVAGSFFESVPAGCDAYMMKNILHDWDDARCGTILAHCRRAMEPGGRLILAEMLVERNDTSSVGPQADLQMMIVCSDGRERSREDFARLLGAAGFKLGRVFPYPTTSVIEGIAV